MPAYITRFGTFLPNAPVPNQKIEQVLGVVGRASETVRDTILERNGIKWRYYAIDPETGKQTHTNTELTVAAIQQLLDTAGLSKDEIDLIACGTSSPDQIIPGHAAMVHGLLKNAPCEVASFAGVCCSSMNALRYAVNSVLAGTAQRAVATGSELASLSLHSSQYEHRTENGVTTHAYIGFSQKFLRFMLSDGAGAALVEPAPRPGNLNLRVEWLEMKSFANELETCMYFGAVKEPDGSLKGYRSERGGIEETIKRGYFNLSQDVKVLGEHIVKVAGRFFVDCVKRHEVDYERVAFLLPHLSSYFFQQPIFEQMQLDGFRVPLDRWFTNLRYKGNTGSASIYIMLDELYQSGNLQPGQQVLCVVPESSRFTFACMLLTVVE